MPARRGVQGRQSRAAVIGQTHCRTCVVSPQQKGKLLTAQATDLVHATAEAATDLGHFLQDPVAGAMAEAVVDRLEVIQVEHDQRHLLAIARSLVEHVTTGLRETVAVADMRQRIGLGPALERHLHALDLVRPVADEAADQQHQQHHQPRVLRGLLVDLLLELQQLILLIQGLDLLGLLQDLLANDLIGKFLSPRIVQVSFIRFGELSVSIQG